MKKVLGCLIVLCLALTPFTVSAAEDKQKVSQDNAKTKAAKDKAAKEKAAKDKAAQAAKDKAKRAAFDKANNKLTKEQRDKKYAALLASEKAAAVEKAERAAFDKANSKLTKDQKDKLYKVKKDTDKKIAELQKSEELLLKDEKSLDTQKAAILKTNDNLETAIAKIEYVEMDEDADEEVDDAIEEEDTLDQDVEANKSARAKANKSRQTELKKLLGQYQETAKLMQEKYKSGKYAEALALKKKMNDIRTQIVKLNKSLIEDEKKIKSKLETFKKNKEKKAKELKEKSVTEDVYAK